MYFKNLNQSFSPDNQAESSTIRCKIPISFDDFIRVVPGKNLESNNTDTINSTALFSSGLSEVAYTRILEETQSKSDGRFFGKFLNFKINRFSVGSIEVFSPLLISGFDEIFYEIKNDRTATLYSKKKIKIDERLIIRIFDFLNHTKF